MRAVTLFKLLNVPYLVTVGSNVLRFAFKTGLPLSPLVKWTIFKQFCGGESLEECRPLLSQFKRDRVWAILDYGAEGEKSEAGFDAAAEEILRTAREAGVCDSIPFIVFKFTGIARFGLLEKISAFSLSSLTKNEAIEWQRVTTRVDSICDAAKDSRRPVMIDAEESWIQGAIDQEAERQMKKRNQMTTEENLPWVFTTVQLYRTDRGLYLERLIQNAKSQGWRVGLKLVRGAYIEKERKRAAEQGYSSPIHVHKKATDEAYDNALEYCFKNLESLALCAGTHNEESCTKAADLVVKAKDASESAQSKVWFSQLYGMSDHLTYNLASAGLNVAKYVPYGPIKAVIPYLIRRAQENSSVAGQSSRELQLLETELRRRSQTLESRPNVNPKKAN